MVMAKRHTKAVKLMKVISTKEKDMVKENIVLKNMSMMVIGTMDK